MSRFPARARVCKVGDRWLVIYPSRRKRYLTNWSYAVRLANEAVSRERDYDRYKRVAGQIQKYEGSYR